MGNGGLILWNAENFDPASGPNHITAHTVKALQINSSEIIAKLSVLKTVIQ